MSEEKDKNIYEVNCEPGKYFCEVKNESHNLVMRQYIHKIGRYRYNWHSALEIQMVLCGRFEVNCDGENFMMEEGDFLLIDSNIGHASLAKQEGCLALVIQLEPEYLLGYFGNPEMWKFGGHTDENSRHCTEAVQIRGILCDMISHFELNTPEAKIRLEQNLNSLLQLLCKLFVPVPVHGNRLNRMDSQNAIIEKSLAFIEEHYAEKITLDDLSQSCGYNTSYLSVFFKNHIGINFYDYLTRIRLREATLDLCATSDTILNIAERNGFSDAKSFNTAFRKAFGKSPNEYRKQIPEYNKGTKLLEKRTYLKLESPEIKEKIDCYVREAAMVMNQQKFSESNRTHSEERIRQLKEEAAKATAQAEKMRENLEQLSEMMKNIMAK